MAKKTFLLFVPLLIALAISEPLIALVINEQQRAVAKPAPTVVPNANFDGALEAEKLYVAIRDMNTADLIEIICSINNSQRQKLSEEFKKAYGKDVIEAMKESKNILLDDSFWMTMIALMKPPAAYDTAYMHGMVSRKNFPVIFEILATRSNAQITALKRAYALLGKNRELEQDIRAKVYGPFRRLLLALLAGTRDETHMVKEQLAREDAKKLYGIGQKVENSETNPSKNKDLEMNKVFAQRNFDQLRLTFDFYKRIANYDIEESINKEFNSVSKAGYLAMVKYIRDSSKYFADLLYNAVKNIPEKEMDLIRLLISRSEIDLADIKHAYQALHRQSLEDAVKSATGRGAFRNVLLALLNGNVPAQNEVPKKKDEAEDKVPK